MKNILLIIAIPFFTFTIISCAIVTGENEDTTTATTATLSAPDNLSASGANNTITLTWNSVSGATSYTLYGTMYQELTAVIRLLHPSQMITTPTAIWITGQLIITRWLQ